MVWRHGGAFGGTCFGFTQPRLPSGGHRRTEVRGSTDGAVSGSAGLVIGFALLVHDQRISLEVERQEEGGSLVCCVVLMIMALTQRFSPSASHIFTLFRCTLPCAFDPRRLVLNFTMHRIIFMACNKTAIEFIELVAWPLLERMLERMGFH